MEKEKTIKQIGFRVTPAIFTWLSEEARKENRTVNNYILSVLLQVKADKEKKENEK